MRYRALWLLLFVLFSSIPLGYETLYASNYNWVQNDWSGGADTGASARHPGDQSSWTRFYSKDTYLNTSIPGQITLFPKPNFWTQTADIGDFDTGRLTRLKIVGNGGYTTTRYEETSPEVTMGGAWTSSINSRASGGSYIYSKSPGSTVSFTFTGVGVTWIGVKNYNYGIANVYLDGVFQGAVDLYSSTAQFQQPLWSITGLVNTTHTLTVEVSGQRNSSSSDTYVGVDAFDALLPNPDTGAYLVFEDGTQFWTQTADIGDFDTGRLTDVKIVGNGGYPTTRYEETSPEVTMGGAWTSSINSRASGGSYIYSKSPGSTVSFTFTGVEVTWIGVKNYNYGIANVYLDGVFQGAVDLYSSAAQFQQPLWSITGLVNTTHTLTVEVSGQRNSSSSDTYVGVDAFDAKVPNPDPGAYLMLSDGVLSGVYESPSFDTGVNGAFFTSIVWNAAVPAGSSLRFQIATNNDNQTWNFVGPDGTSSTFYDISGTTIHSGHGRNRYVRYRAFFSRQTINPADSPTLDDVTLSYVSTIYLQGSYESPSFDVGTGGAFFTSIVWNASVPAGSGLRFQIATNNDNQTWNFVGPDGTSSTFYDIPGTAIYSGHDGDRYVKFNAFFSRQTVNPADSPILNDVTIHFGSNPSGQSLISSPFDTTDNTNVINRWKWSENLPSGTDIALQMRTSPDGITWGAWLGPHATTFSAPQGVSQITVASTSGFLVGSQVTLTDSSNPAQMEAKNITAIDSVNEMITLDSSTSYTYSAGSYFTDTYTDPNGTEPINPVHRSGDDDRWMQYRVFLFTVIGTATPAFLESRIGYFPASGVYQPDGVIEGDGNNVYGAFGSGAGGTFLKDVDPGFKLLSPLTFDVRVQNDGSPGSIDDTYILSWSTPSDVSGSWTVNLNDGVSDLPSPVSVTLNVQDEKVYTLKVTPSSYAPADSTQDILMNIRSESDYAKVDSIKATARVKRAYQADGMIDGNGDNVYDRARGGGGGASLRKNAIPGNPVQYNITLQNEGNIADTYTFSLLTLPLSGWTVLINDGSKDYDISNPSTGWTTPSIPPPPSSGSSVTYTLKIIPRGAPASADILLNIYSNGAAGDIDSLTARINLLPFYKVDGVIYGYGYDLSGNISQYGIMGAGCGTEGPGDDVLGSTGTGQGGCTAVDILAGSSRVITVGVQNEGNVPDTYAISWNTPSGWAIAMQERLSDGTTIVFNAPPVPVPTATAGNPSSYNGGEVPYFNFEITPPSTFTSGSQAIIFDILSTGDAGKFDSVRAVVNGSDTTPPVPVVLSTGNIKESSVTVSWTSPGDDGTSGTAASYDLRYSTSPITDTNFTQAVRVRGCKTGESDLAKPKSPGGPESCTVSQIFANTDYYFALKTSDEAGNISSISTCNTCPVHTLTSSDTTKPGTISDLAVTDVTKDTVTLCWTAPADDAGSLFSGPATGYELRYSTRQIVDDGMTPGVGQVVFSSASIAIPVDGFWPPRSPGMKECYIVPVGNKIDTGGGIIDDRTRNTRFYFAIKALDEARNTSAFSNVTGSLTSLVPNSYNMVSVPYVPNPSLPQDVFGDDVGGQPSVYWWDSMGPNFDSGCYDGEPGPYSSDPAKYTCVKLTSIREGLGYFLWVPPGNIVLDVPSGSMQAPVQNCIDDIGGTFQCYVMLLQEGWNMVGLPFDKEIYFSSRDVGGRIEKGVYVRRTSAKKVEVATFQDAVTAKNWIDSSIYTYNGVNYTFETCNADKTNEPLGTRCSLVMQPWKAYWIRLHVIGGATFELLIPN